MIKGLRAGSEKVYSQLFENYYRPLAIFAFNYVDDIEAAKEIVQDFFVSLYEKRHTLLITSSLQSYLYQSIRNRCLNYLKHKQVVLKHQGLTSDGRAIEEDLESQIMATELEHRIFMIISRLPSRCREIFQLSRFTGLKNNEIAAQLDISTRTVETQISNALKILRSSLGDEIDF